MNEETQKGTMGTSIGIIIVVLLLIIGGVYFYGSKVEKVVNSPKTDQVETPIQVVDSVDTIESDLRAMDTTAGLDETAIK